jgi:ribonucleoside-diphosphate reductase alpha chain
MSKVNTKRPAVKNIRVDPEPMKVGTILEGIRKDVFSDRYSLKDEAGQALEGFPEQMWKRVARGVAQAERTAAKKKEWEEKFYNSLADFKFVPGGRILSGAGTGFAVTYYNCYVLPSPKDSRDGIIDNLKEMVEIMSRGGGVGINLSSLRPRGARVKKVNGFSSGPLNWAELYSVATHDIIQQGGTRRGALMLMLWDWHPDIEEFITVKKDLSRINGANLSVCISDRFMEAVKKGEDWPLIFPDLDDPSYDAKWDGIIENWIEGGGKVKVYKTIKASYLWDLISQAAWDSAEPGVVFMERYNKWHNNYYFNKINCVNPCGEEGLPAYGVCNLGSINLVPFVKEDGSFDFKALRIHVGVAVRFLDNVVDSDIYIFEGIKKTQLQGERRIGVGTMGLGDALIKMKVRYGSEKSLEIIEKVYKTIRDSAYEASCELAKEKGAFPRFDAEKYTKSYFVKQLPKDISKKVRKGGVRNSVILMQAPTGSTSLLAGVTSGIEPVYEFSFIRRDRLGEHIIYHPLYEIWLKDNPGKEKPDYFVSAQELTPEDHVRVQAAIQKYVDASISKTVNSPTTYTVEDVKKLYTLAYELGCKGVTFMRAGSRPGVLETLPEKEKDKVEVKKPEEVKEAPQIASLASKDYLQERPLVVRGSTYRLETPVGKAFVTINEGEDKAPLEVFINVGKAGSDVAAMAEALGRTISTALRFKGSLTSFERTKEIAHQLSGIGGRRSVGFGSNRIRSLPDAVSFALQTHCGFKVNGNGHVGATSHVAGAVMAASGSAPAEQAQVGSSDPTTASAAFDGASTNTDGNGEPNGHEEEANTIYVGKDTTAPGKIYTEATFELSQQAGDICPSCGASALVYEEGCAKCYACGHSEC